MSRFRVLWQASPNATKRVLTWNLEDVICLSKRYIFNFNSKEELKRWHLYSYSEYGGLSSASLEIRDAGNELRGVLSGKLSLDVAEDSKWNISPSGFCGMRSKKHNERLAFYLGEFPPPYDSACIDLPTWRGNVTDVDLEMNPSRIVGMSLSVNSEGGVPGARSGPGDFQVEIDWIKAVRTTQ